MLGGQRFGLSIAHHFLSQTSMPMPNFSSILTQAIKETIETRRSLKTLEAELTRAAELIADCLTNGNKLLVCGNGGSAADAAHFATELVVRFVKDRRAYPANCLTGDGG